MVMRSRGEDSVLMPQLAPIPSPGDTVAGETFCSELRKDQHRRQHSVEQQFVCALLLLDSTSRLGFPVFYLFAPSVPWSRM